MMWITLDLAVVHRRISAYHPRIEAIFILRDVMHHTGVLVLSEFAGAAQSLGAGAILVNPWNITDLAAAIEDALTMSEQVRSLV